MNNSTSSIDTQEENFKESIDRAAELEKECKEKSKDRSSDSCAPLPLQREVVQAKPYPFDALGPIIGAAARRIHEVVQAPDATCGQSVLGALSLACQGFVDVEVDGRIHPISLFMLTISESGERKSSADKVALKPINDWQRQLVEQHKKVVVEYKNKFDIWKRRRDAAIKVASEKEDNCNISSIEFEPQQPCEGLMICSEPTIEGLEQLLERGQPSAGIFSDEGGRLMGGHAMSSENALKTACGLSNLWDGKPFTRVRKSEGSKIFYGRRLAVHLMFQPIVLLQLLNNETLMEQGLLSRCLLSAPMPIAGTRRYREVDLSNDLAILAYYDLLNRIIDHPYPKRSGGHDEAVFRPGDSLEPVPVSLDEEAKKKWIEFHDNIDRKMGLDGELNPIKSFASKAAEQVNRIAVLFAYVDSIDERSSGIKVKIDQVNRAITLVEYYLSEALRIVGKTSSDSNIYLAVLTLDWIKRNRPDQTFPLADIYQRGPNQIRTSRTAKKIMRILEEHGYVFELVDEVINGKKTRSAWRLKDA